MEFYLFKTLYWKAQHSGFSAQLFLFFLFLFLFLFFLLLFLLLHVHNLKLTLLTSQIYAAQFVLN